MQSVSIAAVAAADIDGDRATRYCVGLQSRRLIRGCSHCYLTSCPTGNSPTSHPIKMFSKGKANEEGRETPFRSDNFVTC